MIPRPLDEKAVRARLNQFKVTAILGPRQSGKTTLAGLVDSGACFDLENPRDLARLENPQLTLEKCSGTIIIDEIQRKPDLFPLIRYLVDSREDQKYLILGSASRDLIQQGCETLAGRISFFTLTGLRMHDIPENRLSSLWLRGGLPPSFTAPDDAASFLWRENYILTFLERDIPNLGIRIPANTLHRFWMMTSHYHGKIINYSEIGRSFGIADTTVRQYFDILQGTFMIRQLQPWYVNIKKRLVKRPKCYFRDSGILHSLLAIETMPSLQSHPALGRSWEGFALDCVWRSIGKPDENAYFWSTHTGAEVDLFWQHDGRNWACEFKYADAPVMTKSMHAALNDLDLEKLWVIYPGDKRYDIHEKVEALPLSQAPAEWEYP